MRLPGREDRLADPPYASLSRLADDAATAISGLDAKPFALCGHSLGAYVALEVARRLISQGRSKPSHLIVAACGAPRPGPARQPIGHLPDEDFLKEVDRRYAGIPAAIRADEALLAMILPALRADMQMIESYEYDPQTPLPIDMLALGGADDPGVPVHRLSGWQQETSARFTMRLFPGGHFFLHPPPRRATASDRGAVPPPLATILETLSSKAG